MTGNTIRDVARQAGVSTATVSRVINGNSHVDACLVARVHQAVASLGYVPNTVARSLKADRTMLVGLLISDIGNPYFSAIAKALETSLGHHGYTLLIGSTEEGPEREQRLLDGMLGRKADGLILNSTGRNDAMLAAISQRLPVVLLNRRIRARGFAVTSWTATTGKGRAPWHSACWTPVIATLASFMEICPSAPAESGKKASCPVLGNLVIWAEPAAWKDLASWMRRWSCVPTRETFPWRAAWPEPQRFYRGRHRSPPSR